MAEITASLVKALRERTGAGMMECKKALVEAEGDPEKAEVVLRKHGIAAAGKKASRATRQGLIGSYIHAGGQLGVMVEVNCESDFVARTSDFKELVHDVAMHIAAADPRYLRREDVPSAILDQEREIARDRARNEGKPEKILDKIVQDESPADEGMMEYTEYVDPKYAEKIMAESLSMEEEPSSSQRKGPASETAEPEPEPAALKEGGH